jgi:hypothetical protein
MRSQRFASALSQAYPVKPIRVIISFAPGGSLDLVARLLAPRMAESMGQPVIGENRAGAGGYIGTKTITRAAPDGYTILFTTPSTHVTDRFLNKIPLRSGEDFNDHHGLDTVLVSRTPSPNRSAEVQYGRAIRKVVGLAGTAITLPAGDPHAHRCAAGTSVHGQRFRWLTLRGRSR